MSSSSSSRLPLVDALKALAAQCIVLHHLAAYGPVAEAVQELAPALIDWLYQYGRMAVQVFLVVGGYLSARGLLADGQALRADADPGALLWKRYQRLGLPFIAAVLLTLGCSWLVAPWLPELVPQQVGVGQLLAHALLLHGVLGYESLTVGAWYVAIDLQLFALLLGLAWLSRRVSAPLRAWAAPLLVLAVLLASLLVFNRDAALDAWAPYFFGAYGMGALLHLLLRNPRLRPHRWLLLGMLALLVLASLGLEFRARIALALATALLLAAWELREEQPLLRIGERLGRLLDRLGTQSYALFLVHFSVLLLVNALFEHKDPEHPWIGPLAMLAAWGLSNMAAALFYRWVEQPAARAQVALPALLRRI
jgi:peptidoglycan/LPS O-acetylase OafA/YrhL